MKARYFLIVTFFGFASTANADGLNAVGRILGLGWSDGYHWSGCLYPCPEPCGTSTHSPIPAGNPQPYMVAPPMMQGPFVANAPVMYPAQAVGWRQLTPSPATNVTAHAYPRSGYVLPFVAYTYAPAQVYPRMQ